MSTFVKIPQKFKKIFKLIFWSLALTLLFYIILPDKETIEQTIEAIQGVSLSYVILGSAIYYLTIPIFALQIFVLSKIKLNYWITYKVQMSVLFINKFIPAGIASFVMNSFYLARKGHKPSEVASVVAMQGLTSSIPFIFLLIIAVILALTKFNLSGSISFDIGDIHWVRILALIFLIIFLAYYLLNRSTKLKELYDKTLGSFWTQLLLFRERPGDLFMALLTGLISPLLGVTILYISAYSVGLEVSFIQAFLIYSLGTTIANIVPVPGGLGAAIAGLYAGFIIFGYSEANALAASLVYRLITFWIPIVPGFIFFVNLKNDVLKGFSLAEEFQKVKKAKKQ